MNAMLLITAAKIQKAKKKHLYALKYLKAVSDMADCFCDIKKEESNNVLLVAVGTNKGLCGNFNDKIISEIKSYAGSNVSSFELCILGKNLKNLYKSKIPIFFEDSEIIRTPSFENISKVSKKIYEWFCLKNGKVYIVYNEYKSILVQKPHVFQVLPLKYNASLSQVVVEPSTLEIMEAVVVHYIDALLCKILAESELGEHNARMVLVKGATDTSSDLLADLVVQINKERQAVITAELAEIVSSFEALQEGEE